MTGEIPYYNVPINEIITNVGSEGKQVQLPTKGNPIILALMKSCLSLTKYDRPTFKEIVGQLQQRNKTNLPSKKRNLII